MVDNLGNTVLVGTRCSFLRRLQEASVIWTAQLAHCLDLACWESAWVSHSEPPRSPGEALGAAQMGQAADPFPEH